MPSSSTRFDLTGRTAVVTGGGRGLGLALAQGLAEHGASVVVAGRTETTLAAACEQITATGGTARYVVADVAREEDVARLAEAAADPDGRIHVLINNAGINPYYEAPEKTPLAHWQQIIDVNLTGVFLCCAHIGRRMLSAGEGSIINISSVAGHRGLAKSAAYCAAKGGLEMMTRSLALDWAKKGVRVNTIAPGYVETDLTSAMLEHPVLGERILSRTPLGRFGTAEDMVGAAVFLASPSAAYVTGQSIGVDGGWTAV